MFILRFFYNVMYQKKESVFETTIEHIFRDLFILQNGVAQ